MFQTYIPKSLHFFFVLLILTTYFLEFYFCCAIFLGIYPILCFLFRKTSVFWEEFSSEKALAFHSPFDGKVLKVEKQSESWKLLVRLPWWKQYGLFMPIPSEIRDVTSEKIVFFSEISGEVTLQVMENFLNFGLKTWIMPGDRADRFANVAFLPFGGMVSVTFPGNYDVLVAGSDEVSAGETLLAVRKS